MRLLACAVLAAVIGGSATAAAADDRTTCGDESGDAAIAACSRAIASGRYKDQELAILYYNRGSEYKDKGDVDRAIADYSEAIRLDPKFAEAHTNRGVAWYHKGELDRAIADYNEAIWLDPKDADPYNNRGLARDHKGEFDRAIADYTEAIRLDPKDAVASYNRGLAWDHKGDFDRAIADYTEAIRLDPKLALAYFNRGRARLYAGALPKALSDLDQASELDPSYAYVALWLDIANRRSNLASRLAEASKQIDMTKWPSPVIRLYLGQSTAEVVLSAAGDPDLQTKKRQVCEANFYTGQLALQQGNKDEAMRRFRLAEAGCLKGFTEYEDARAELKAMGVSP